MSKVLNPFERNELVKAMIGRGVDYETAELIIRDFNLRIEHLYSLSNPALNVCTPKLPTIIK